MEDILFDLYYKSAHRNEELEQTIEELQNGLKYRKNENIRLAEENKELKKEIERLTELIDIRDDVCIDLVEENTTLKNDYKKCYAENVRISEENNQLKFRNKMLTKIGLNSIYGIHCCKNHCVYTDTDSIKETKDNDSNN